MYCNTCRHGQLAFSVVASAQKVTERVFETDQPAADLHLELCLALTFGLLNRRAVRLIVQVVVPPLSGVVLELPHGLAHGRLLRNLDAVLQLAGRDVVHALEVVPALHPRAADLTDCVLEDLRRQASADARVAGFVAVGQLEGQHDGVGPLLVLLRYHLIDLGHHLRRGAAAVVGGLFQPLLERGAIRHISRLDPRILSITVPVKSAIIRSDWEVIADFNGDGYLQVLVVKKASTFQDITFQDKISK